MENLSGQRFKSLLVTDEYKREKQEHGTKIKWKCVCDCGNVLFVYADALKRRRVDYCSKCRPRGVRNDRLYHIFHGMIQRCYNTKNPNYKKYGSAGIVVCDQWKNSYDEFRYWAQTNGYKEGLTIDRIDPHGNYCPENCRWVSLGENGGRANIGVHKNKTRLINPEAVSPDGEVYRISNISLFARENGLNRAGVSAALHGRCDCEYMGWRFSSNKSKQ